MEKNGDFCFIANKSIKLMYFKKIVFINNQNLLLKYMNLNISVSGPEIRIAIRALFIYHMFMFYK